MSDASRRPAARSVRYARRQVLIAAVASTLLASLGTRAFAGAAPSGCTSIASVPVTKSIQYVAAIQNNIFHDFNGQGNGCADCHTTAGGVTPAGDLDLDFLDTPSPYVNLINVGSTFYPGRVFVVPGHPEESFLFWKVNCDFPVDGDRMPFNNYGGGLSAEQQAVIYDWIAAGAPVGTTDALFRGTFDVRGFAP